MLCTARLSKLRLLTATDISSVTTNDNHICKMTSKSCHMVSLEMTLGSNWIPIWCNHYEDGVSHLYNQNQVCALVSSSLLGGCYGLHFTNMSFLSESLAFRKGSQIALENNLREQSVVYLPVDHQLAPTCLFSQHFFLIYSGRNVVSVLQLWFLHSLL